MTPFITYLKYIKTITGLKFTENPYNLTILTIYFNLIYICERIINERGDIHNER